MLSHRACQVLAGCCHLWVHLALEPWQCSPGRGQCSVLKSSPVKPRLGPKLLGVQAGRGSLNIFGMPASVYLCLCLLGVLTHTPPTVCQQPGGEAQLMPSICALQGLSAGHGSSNSALLLYPKRTAGKRQEFLLLAAKFLAL